MCAAYVQILNGFRCIATSKSGKEVKSDEVDVDVSSFYIETDLPKQLFCFDDETIHLNIDVGNKDEMSIDHVGNYYSSLIVLFAHVTLFRYFSRINNFL